jgi:predicted secreted protein
MDAILTSAVFIICWWLCFFCLLPVGVKNLDEAGEAPSFGQERAAPARADLKKKAVWAAGLAVVLTAVIWVLVAIDAFGLRG